MTLNTAMIATGGIADKQLAPALAAANGARLWSVFSRDRARALAFAERHGAAAPAPAYDDLDSLLADPQLDAVIIASPDRLHSDQVIAAARAGKHVLVEKPMATDRAGAEEMVAACADAGVTLAVAYHMRWHPGHRALHTAVAGGALGELRHMRIMWPTPARDASGWRARPEVGRWWSLAAVGTHCLDQIRWFMVAEYGEIEAFESVISNGILGSTHDETAVLAMKFASGATAELCTSVLFHGPRRMEIFGSEGFAICDETLGPHGGGEIRTHEGDFPYAPGNPYLGEIEDFARAAAEGTPPEVDGVEGARNVDLLLRAIGE